MFADFDDLTRLRDVGEKGLVEELVAQLWDGGWHARPHHNLLQAHAGTERSCARAGIDLGAGRARKVRRTLKILLALQSPHFRRTFQANS